MSRRETDKDDTYEVIFYMPNKNRGVHYFNFSTSRNVRKSRGQRTVIYQLNNVRCPGFSEPTAMSIITEQSIPLANSIMKTTLTRAVSIKSVFRRPHAHGSSRLVSRRTRYNVT